MKQKRLFLRGILSIGLVFGLFLVGCDTGNSGDSGGGGGGGNLTAPQNVSVLPDNQRIIVSWNAVTGATGYQVVYGRGLTEPPTNLSVGSNMADVSSANTTTLISGLTNGNEYSVWVRGKTSDTANPYTAYSTKKTVVPTPSDNMPGKPQVTVTATDNGQLKITWPAVQYASDYSVLLGTTNSILVANTVAQNITTLTYTTVDNNLTAGTLIYYVRVVARNTNPATPLSNESDPVQGTIIDAPMDLAAFSGTTWKAEQGSDRYQFTSNSVAFYQGANTNPDGNGTYSYNKPNLRITITGSQMANQPGAWAGNQDIKVQGKTFTVNNVTYTRQ